MNIPYMCITGNEINEDLETLKNFENVLNNETTIFKFPGWLFSLERAENCYNVAIENLLKPKTFKISKFLSSTFTTLLAGTLDEESLLYQLPIDVIKEISSLKNTYLFPSFAYFNQIYISKDAQKILETNEYVVSLMRSPLPKIIYDDIFEHLNNVDSFKPSTKYKH